MTVDHYKILGVDKSATEVEIKSAYRKLSRKYHPDISEEPDAHDRMAEITKAYEVLSNPEKRENYDLTGGDAPPPLESEARSIVCGLVVAFVENHGEFPTAGLQSFLQNTLRTQIQQIRNNVSHGESISARLTRNLKRLKFKGAGPDIARNALQMKIDEIERKIALEKVNIERHELALKVAADYDYEASVSPTSPSLFGTLYLSR